MPIYFINLFGRFQLNAITNEKEIIYFFFEKIIKTILIFKINKHYHVDSIFLSYIFLSMN